MTAQTAPTGHHETPRRLVVVTAALGAFAMVAIPTALAVIPRT